MAVDMDIGNAAAFIHFHTSELKRAKFKNHSNNPKRHVTRRERSCLKRYLRPSSWCAFVRVFFIRNFVEGLVGGSPSARDNTPSGAATRQIFLVSENESFETWLVSVVLANPSCASRDGCRYSFVFRKSYRDAKTNAQQTTNKWPSE